jgi:hypothetical protein
MYLKQSGIYTILLLEPNPILDSAHVVAQVQSTSRLNTTQNTLSERLHFEFEP